MKRGVGLALVVALTGCTGGAAVETTSPPVTSPDTAVGAARALLGALSKQDYLGAAQLTVPGQMVVVALIEGMTPGEATTLIENDEEVGVNFWSGFVDTSGGAAAMSSPAIGDATPFTAAGEDFAWVEVLFSGPAGTRTIVMRRLDTGWRVDAIATFAAALAGRFQVAAAAAVASPQLTSVLQAQRPSLEAVLEAPDLSPDLQQAVLATLVALDR